jgi:hypothetical protein
VTGPRKRVRFKAGLPQLNKRRRGMSGTGEPKRPKAVAFDIIGTVFVRSVGGVGIGRVAAAFAAIAVIIALAVGSANVGIAIVAGSLLALSMKQIVGTRMRGSAQFGRGR